MKRIQKILFVAGTTLGLMLGIGTAKAQVSNTGVASAGVDVTLTGTVESSIMLTVDVASTGTTGLTNTGPASATVNFGTFNTTSGFTAAGNGTWERNGAGAWVGAELTATATYSGGAGTASIDITRPDAGTNMTGLGLQVKDTVGTPWPAYNAANDLAIGAPVSLCPNGLVSPNGNCASGDVRSHALGVYVPDSTLPTTFTQTVNYTATIP